jgi:hypothetical protein
MANPNPNEATRFKPGQIANPTGKTAEQAARDIKTADLASQFRAKVLSSVMERANAGEDALELLTADVIRVLKDSEDRAHGTPKQSVEHAGPRGGPIQTIDPSKVSTETLREIMGAMRDEAPEPDEG